MLLRDLEQSQRGAVGLALPLLPGTNGVWTHVQRCCKDRLREFHVVTDLANSTSAVLRWRLDFSLSDCIARDSGRLELAASDLSGLAGRLE